MQNIWEQIQPQVSGIVLTIVGILATVVLSLLALLKVRVSLWIDTKTSAAQRELLHKIANEAFAYAEATLNSGDGRLKLNQAFLYASEKLGKLGIQVSSEEINAAIEKACLDYNASKNNGNGNKAS